MICYSKKFLIYESSILKLITLINVNQPQQKLSKSFTENMEDGNIFFLPS